MKYRIIAVQPTGAKRVGKLFFNDAFAAIEHAKKVMRKYACTTYIELIEEA